MKGEARNLAASVLARLQAISRERQEDFQLVLQRYALERLLYRLSQSPHRERFVLKGAMLFAVWGQEVWLDQGATGEAKKRAAGKPLSLFCSGKAGVAEGLTSY